MDLSLKKMFRKYALYIDIYILAIVQILLCDDRYIQFLYFDN
jgi:hypothetical protein